jgi:hypothetical protein
MTSISRIALAALLASSFALPVLAQPTQGSVPVAGASASATTVPAGPVAHAKKPTVNTNIHRAAAPDAKPLATKPAESAKPAVDAKGAATVKPDAKPTVDGKTAIDTKAAVKPGPVATAPIATAPITGTTAPKATN